jgi:hypothetical protein
MINGARNALLGYLYQLLGTASVQVRRVDPGDDAWADLIARVNDGEVRGEEFGQDATIRPVGMPDCGVAFIQFKHSATTGKVIERAEFIEILFAFDRSRMEAKAEGVTIDRYVLITNRDLDAKAQDLTEQGRTSTSPPEPLRLEPTTRKGEPIAENARRLALYGGDPDAAARAWHLVLKALDVFPKMTLEADLIRLRSFAAQYGVLEQEFDARLNALIGAFVGETSAGRTVKFTREWLRGQLAGDPNAANLQFSSNDQPHISTACRRQLEHRMGIQHRIPDQYYLYRDAQRRIRDQLAVNPVVFVYGEGGCGKSLAVAQYLRSVCDRQLVWSESATTATEMGIVQAINSVRFPGCPGARTDQCLTEVRARLNVANLTTRLLWTIDLDGIDEAPDRRVDLQHLINVCWAGGSCERSPASLVVTCRSPSGTRPFEELVSEWIATPEPDLVQGIGSVSVGEFVNEDLVQAAQLLGGQPEKRIIRILEQDLVSTSNSLLPDEEPIVDDTLQALRHPVVWGNYASMGESDRAGVLDGNPTSLARLAERFFKRFLLRCAARERWSDNRMLEQALRAAAHHSITGTPPFNIRDWEHGCAPSLGQSESHLLYRESLTYGLIRRETRASWRWRHRFVVDYLASHPTPMVGE